MKRLLFVVNALLGATSLAAGSFQPPELWSSAPLDVRNVSPADFDGDGRLDLSPSGVGPDSAMGPAFRWMVLNRGTSFAAPVAWTGSNVPATEAFVGDFNGDGRPDLLDRYGQKVSLNLGGLFAPSTDWGARLSAPNPHAAATLPFTGRFVTATRDDYAQLLSRANTQIGDAIFFYGSMGSYFSYNNAWNVPREAQAALTFDAPAMLWATGDVTGDGLTDVVFASKVTGDVYVSKNYGTALGLAPAKLWAAGLPIATSIVLAKMDRDADADLIIVRASGDVVVARAGGESFVSASTHGIGCTTACWFGDFTGDGWGDAVTSDGFGFQLRRWVETPTAPPPPWQLPPIVLPPLKDSLFPPMISVHGALVQGGASCGNAAVVSVDPLRTTRRILLEAVDASGARRRVAEWNAPLGGELNDPILQRDLGLTNTTTSYVATATYNDGNVQTASVGFTRMPGWPFIQAVDARLSGTNVVVRMSSQPSEGFTGDQNVGELLFAIGGGTPVACTRASNTYTCTVSRAAWSRAHATGFTATKVVTRSGLRCNGQPQQIIQNGGMLSILPSFDSGSTGGGSAGGGSAGGGSAGGGTAPMPAPNLVLSIAAHDGQTAHPRVCNMGTVGVPASATGIGFTWQSVGWISSMRLDVSSLARLGVGDCNDLGDVSIGVSAGAGGGSLLPASSVHFCIDDANVVAEGAGELDNCIDVRRSP